jgi:hypothetical protein
MISDSSARQSSFSTFTFINGRAQSVRGLPVPRGNLYLEAG